MPSRFNKIAPWCPVSLASPTAAGATIQRCQPSTAKSASLRRSSLRVCRRRLDPITHRKKCRIAARSQCAIGFVGGSERTKGKRVVRLVPSDRGTGSGRTRIGVGQHSYPFGPRRRSNDFQSLSCDVDSTPVELLLEALGVVTGGYVYVERPLRSHFSL